MSALGGGGGGGGGGEGMKIVGEWVGVGHRVYVHVATFLML